ncbi:MAG TPA: choice-of-anchor D domain-containing protein [Terracidiphilus sp.]|nr:choice-of-anchor D domain-containing protein [Terracidiphilus sp.]
MGPSNSGLILRSASNSLTTKRIGRLVFLLSLCAFFAGIRPAFAKKPVATLSVSSKTVNFGNVVSGQTAIQSITLSASGRSAVTISSLSISGSLFTASGIATPLMLNPGQSATLTLHFYAQGTGQYTGVLTIASNSSAGNITVNMSGNGVAASGVLSGLSCSTSSFAGAGTDACTVILNAAAGSGGLAVNLSSNDSAVAVPASVTVPSGTSSASFNATVSAVTSAQTATLTASSGGITETFAVQLSVATAILSVNATSISFGSVVINTPATQTLTLKSTGASAVTVSAASISGAGFSVSGQTFPLTLNAGQSASLYVQFDPASAGSASGSLTITSNASGGSKTVISLSGTGLPHEINLGWSAPGGSDPIAGYNVYRAVSGSNSYERLNSALNATTAYSDTTAQSSVNYEYYVTSVDKSGMESTPSNYASVSVP